jgi:hypothetical protein
MFLHWTLDMRRPRLIFEAHLAWRFGSVQAAVLLALLSGVQAEVLPLVAPLFSPEAWPWVSGLLALAIVLLRLVAQPGLEAVRQRDFERDLAEFEAEAAQIMALHRLTRARESFDAELDNHLQATDNKQPGEPL